MRNKKTSLPPDKINSRRAAAPARGFRAALFFFPVLFIFICAFLPAAPLNSPTWGFSLDLPEGYEYSGGDRKDKFSFTNGEGAQFDISVYYAAQGKSEPYAGVEALAEDVRKKLNSSGEIGLFEYRQKNAAFFELSFAIPGSGPVSGWALCMELGAQAVATAQRGATRGNNQVNNSSARPLLLAMAYGPAGKSDLTALHLSALDSFIPEEGDRYVPGPVTEFTYPRETRILSPIFGMDVSAHIYEEDAEAAQAVIDREFKVLHRYMNAPNWQEAWQRFYRLIYRDSFDRVADIAFRVERELNLPPLAAPADGQTEGNAGTETEPRASVPTEREFADKVLKWVQSFKYERDLLGSDFINIITAAVEGRGDCDNRAMLWALVLKQAGIPSAIMVSRHYGHAMGLASLPGAGARFEVDGQKLLVAETTADVSTGLIGETVSDIEYWLGILFE